MITVTITAAAAAACLIVSNRIFVIINNSNIDRYSCRCYMFNNIITRASISNTHGMWNIKFIVGFSSKVDSVGSKILKSIYNIMRQCVANGRRTIVIVLKKVEYFIISRPIFNSMVKLKLIKERVKRVDIS